MSKSQKKNNNGGEVKAPPSKESKLIAETIIYGCLFLVWNVVVTAGVTALVWLILQVVGYKIHFVQIFGILLAAQLILGLLQNGKRQSSS